jgi:Fe-coproporphyrin III synthase
MVILRNSLEAVTGKISYPKSLSIDVTNRCQMNCRHCYFMAQKHSAELPAEALLARIRDLKKKYPSIIHGTWVGGEPLLRKNVVYQGIKLFPFNFIVTNGLIELPNWKNCSFTVSVDGTKEYFEKTRKPGVYDKVKKNADRNDIKLTVTFCINKINHFCVEDFVKEWRDTKISGVNFSFCTPVKGSVDDLRLTPRERNPIIKRIFKLKQKYKNFIVNTDDCLKMLTSRYSSEVTSNCIGAKAMLFMKPNGEINKPCAVGPDPDCKNCGNFMPFMIHSVLEHPSISNIRNLTKYFS